MKYLLTAFNLTTTLSLPASKDWQAGDRGRASVWYPFVGLIIGGLTWLMWMGATPLSPPPKPRPPSSKHGTSALLTMTSSQAHPQTPSPSPQLAKASPNPTLVPSTLGWLIARAVRQALSESLDAE